MAAVVEVLAVCRAEARVEMTCLVVTVHVVLNLWESTVCAASVYVLVSECERKKRRRAKNDGKPGPASTLIMTEDISHLNSKAVNHFIFF